MSQFETCTTTCQGGIPGGGAGQLYLNYYDGIATDSSGDVYVADFNNDRIDEFSAAGAFLKAYGWGVVDAATRFETCTSTCQPGIPGGGAGQLWGPDGVAIDPSGHVYVADFDNQRIDEFSAAGAFLKAYGWGVVPGMSAQKFETCTSTSTCQGGSGGGGAGQLDDSTGVATDSLGDVYVVGDNERIDEFSAAGAFMKGYGWGVVPGMSPKEFETCTSTSTCQVGTQGAGAGQFDGTTGGVATDPSGHVYVADADGRIDEFSAAGAFLKAYGWGVIDGANRFETCTTTSTCQVGLAGAGAGELESPRGVATDSSGDVYVTDFDTERINEFSAGGAFIGAYGWGVADRASHFETCTTTSTCRYGLYGGGAGEFYRPTGVATDPSGGVYVADYYNRRIDEFSAAPAAPTAVKAVSGSTTTATGSLTVTFTLGADNGSAITSQTANCTSSNGGVTETGTHSGATAAPIMVLSVTTGKTYTCTVTATNARGASLASAPSLPVIVGAPAAPTAVKAVSGSTTTATGSLTVTFTLGADNGSAITSQTARCTSSNGGVTETGTHSAASAAAIQVLSVTTGKTYTCTVTATNARGASLASAPSPPVIVGAPAAPTGVSAARVAAGQLRVTFTPGANNGSTTTGYTASCASTNGGATSATSGTASPLTVTGLTAGKSYTCTVTATNARGTSPPSNASSPVTA
jgi:Fibronectin type III domain/NHL repeat